MTKVVVGLSGGVDSSASAALLQQQGYDVVGLTLWLMKGKGQCCSEGLVDAAAICDQLGVEHHVVDSREDFEKYIVNFLVEGYSSGITPLPCSQCNSAVKFGPMLAYARAELGADYIATGHYARVDRDPNTGRFRLKRAFDRNKDQTYFLYDLDQDALGHSLFPLGERQKTETRQIAADSELVTAEKPESQDLCLVETHGTMRDFLAKYLAPKPGDIVDTEGNRLGQHDGIQNYTIGQRKGLGIAAAHPLYVVEIDAGKNQVVVGDRDRVHSDRCHVSRVNWVSITEPSAPIRASVQVRYRSRAVEATIVPLDGQRVAIQFDEPQFGITPGQAAVWYDDDVLLGGGIIDRPSPPNDEPSAIVPKAK